MLISCQGLSQIAQRLHDRRMHGNVGKFLFVNRFHDGVVGHVIVVLVQDLGGGGRQRLKFGFVGEGRGRVLVERVPEFVVQVVQDGVNVLAALGDLGVLVFIMDVLHAGAVLDLLQISLGLVLHSDPDRKSVV